MKINGIIEFKDGRYVLEIPFRRIQDGTLIPRIEYEVEFKEK